MTFFTRYYVKPLNTYAQTRLNLPLWWLLALVSYGLARVLQVWLDQSYAASQFPVPFYIGQTTFDAAELKGYYQHLLDKNTMAVYIRTQLIDYCFMVGTFLSFYCLATALMRSVRTLFPSGILLRIACIFVWLSPLAAVMDAFENLVSFVMLSAPTSFPDWLAYPYSSFAVTKFGLFAITYLWTLFLLLLFLAYGLLRMVALLSRSANVTEGGAK